MKSEYNMPLLDLRAYFGLKDKSALISAITANAGQGAGKSLSATLKFTRAMEEHGVNEGSAARVKLSNFYAWCRRGFWGYGLDPNRADTIAEFVGSRMAAALSDPARDGYSSAPTVDLFADNKGAFGLVSLYVKGVEGSLDDVRDDLYEEAECKKNSALISSKQAKNLQGEIEDEIKEGKLSDKEAVKLRQDIEVLIVKNRVSKQKGHARLVCSSDPNAEPLKIDPNNPKAMIVGGYLKKELCKSMALRALMGDHDGNPGNYLFVKDAEGRRHVAGIDYGHAFNDMIKSMSDGGRPRADGILNYLNQGTNFGKSKLTNFSGLVPDADFAEALRETSDPARVAKMTEATSQAVQEIKELRARGVSEKRLTDTIKTLCARMGDPIGKGEEKTFKHVMERFEGVACNFVKKNAEEMRSVANLVDVQVEIDKALKSGQPIDMGRIEKLYQQDEKYLKGKSFKDTIEWPKTDGDKSAKKCSVVEYAAHRAKQLKANGEVKLNDQEIKTTITNFKQSAMQIDKDNKKTKEMIVAANLELIQAEVFEAVRGNRSVDKKMIATIYDKHLDSKSMKDKIDWPAYGNTKAKKCSLDKYIESVTPHKQRPNKLSWTEKLLTERGMVSSLSRAL